MNRILLTILLFSIFNLEDHPAAAQSTVSSTTILLGINGHPVIGQPDYLAVPITRQIELIKELGLKYYRVDVLTDGNGIVIEKDSRQRMDNLCLSAQKNGIELVPMLYTNGMDYNATTLKNYQVGFQQGLGFAKRYKQYIHYCELGNELEMTVTLSSIDQIREDGNAIVGVDDKKMTATASYLNGLSKGIHSVNKNIKTVINFSFYHLWFIKLLKKYNVDFDIVGNHFYTNAGNHTTGYDSLMIRTSKVYNDKKKIWITEFNYPKGSTGVIASIQGQAISDFIVSARKLRNVKAVFIYELMNQPHLAVPESIGYEKYFGICNLDKNGNAVLSEVAKSYLKFSQSNK